MRVAFSNIPEGVYDSNELSASLILNHAPLPPLVPPPYSPVAFRSIGSGKMMGASPGSRGMLDSPINASPVNASPSISIDHP